jgi:hypothetical protein
VSSLVPSSWFAALAELGTAGRVGDALASGLSAKEVERHIAGVEAHAARAPRECFVLDDDGWATLVTSERSYGAGRFSTPSIAELWGQARARVKDPDRRARISLAILSGTGALTDVGALQATSAPGTLFQVASQFNCLEAPGPNVVPVSEYVHDYTQGPRASVSAFPATLLRHYFAPGPGGERFVQTDARHLDLLDGALDAQVAQVRSGYLQSSAFRDPARAAELLRDRFERIKVGLHEGVEVVFGNDWGGPVLGTPTIDQVFTSTVAQGAYGRDDGTPALREIRVQLLRAAYLGTLLSALASGSRVVVLTLIGGGVFGNPPEDIWGAIFWACDQVDGLGGASLTVLVNGRDRVTAEAKRSLFVRGGAYIDASTDRIVLERRI